MPLGPTWLARGPRRQWTGPGSPTGFLGPGAWGECQPCLPWSSCPGGSPHPHCRIHLSSSPLLPPSHAHRTQESGEDPGEWRTGLGAQPASWGQSGQGKRLPHLPWSSVLKGPSHLPLLFFPPPPSYAPRTNAAQRGPRKLEDLAQEPHRLPGADWAGERLDALPPILQAPQGPSRHGNPSHLPATFRGCGSHPASTPPPPSLSSHPTRSLGGSFCLLGCQGPPPASGRCPSCGEMWTPYPPLPPSWLRPQ